MISYSLDDSGIFYVKFSGIITVEDIEAYLLKFGTLSDLPEDFLSLYDLRDAEMNLDKDDILSISELTEKVTASYKTVRTAFLVNKPVITAYTYLFTTELAPDKTIREVFSTEEAALTWLAGKNDS